MSHFYVDEKVTMWVRHYFNPDKVTKEKLVKKLTESDDLSEVTNKKCGSMYSESLEDTMEVMSTEDNNKQSTLILFECEDGNESESKEVWNNATGETR